MARVLHIITDLGAGGAERMLARVVTAKPFSHGTNHIVVCLMDEGVHGPAIRAAGVELHCLRARSGRFGPLHFLRLIRLVRAARPDAVMTWLYHADVLGLLATLTAGLSPGRVIWNLRSTNTDFSRYGRGLRLMVRLGAWLSPLPGCITVNAEGGKTHHAAIGYRPREWRHLPNAFDMAEWRPDPADRVAVRDELGLAQDDVAFVLSARVDPAKDHAGFLDACRIVAGRDGRARFVLIGQGTDRLDLPDGLHGKVIALGQRPDVQRLLRGMDFGVSSSAFGEGFPNALGEAMATGLPCVATDVGASATILGDTGWVVPPSAPDRLADAMLEALDLGATRREAMGAEARDWIAGRFSVPALAPAYVAMWDEVAGRAAGFGKPAR